MSSPTWLARRGRRSCAPSWPANAIALVLGAMKNVRIHASVDEIAKSLQGYWRAEHLFALKQALGAFDFVGTQLAECDQEIEAQLQRLQVQDGEMGRRLSA